MINFDKYQTPPNFLLAYLHGECCKLYEPEIRGRKKSEKIKGEIDRCPCCGGKKGQKNSLFVQINPENGMGGEIPQFFKMVGYLTVLILVIILIKVGEFVFICNECQSIAYAMQIQGYQALIPVGFFNKSYLSLMVQVSAYSLMLMLIKVFLKNQKYKYKSALDKVQDKSLQLTNVSKKATEQDIKQVLQDLQVKRVILTYKVNTIHETIKQIIKCEHKLDSIRIQPQGTQYKITQKQQLKRQIQSLKIKLNQYKQIQRQQRNRTSMVFVELENQQQKTKAFNLFRCNFFAKIFYKLFPSCSRISLHGKHISVQQSPPIEDIRWQNLETPYLTTKLIRFCSFLICLTALVFGMVSQIFYITNPDYFFEGNEYITTVIIFFTNAFTINVLQWSTEYLQRHRTFTDFKLSLIRKLTFFMFFNISMTPLLIFMYHKRYITDPQKRKTLQDIGFQIILIGISNCLKPVLTVFSVQRVMKWYHKQKQKRQGDRSVLYQMQANKLFEPLEFPIQLYYSLVHTSFMMIFLYLQIFPILVVVELLALLMMHLIARWMLLRVCKNPKSLTLKLSNLAQSLMRFYVPLFFIGNNITLMLIQLDQSDPINWGTIVQYFIMKDLYLSISFIIVIFMIFSEAYITGASLLFHKFFRHQQYASNQKALLAQQSSCQAQANTYRDYLGQNLKEILHRIEKDLQPSLQ